MGLWGIALLSCLPFAADGPELSSDHRIVSRELDGASGELARLRVRVLGRDHSESAASPRPVRAIARGADGRFVDGSGRGLYADGRFFADGEFSVDVPPGKTRLELRSGPEFVPLELDVEARAGETVELEATLSRWFSPSSRHCYGGDNHVHAQHDRNAAVRTDLEYTVLQARANGLSFVTEAGSNVDYESLPTLNREDFRITRADEVRPGAFTGHFNTPGISAPLDGDWLRELSRRILPGQALREAVHDRGGAVIHTHPMTPRHQIHWMGAAEVFPDAVLGRCADALDLDSEATERLWHAVLNLGNRVACSGYTDCALGRTRTLSPGDRRVYVHSGGLQIADIADAIRRGRTFATSGGPLFAFFRVDGQLPGSTLPSHSGRKHRALVEVAHLEALKAVQLTWRGREVARFVSPDRAAVETFGFEFEPPAGELSGWLSARAEDVEGNWAVTSPVYFEAPTPPKPARRSAIVFQISNATRFIELRKQFFAHVLATVSQGSALARVELLRDGSPVKTFSPGERGERHEGKTPVTELGGDYGPGWAFHPAEGAPHHFQADWPVSERGWYRVRAVLADGSELDGDALHFSPRDPDSRALSSARLDGADTFLRWWGYGEEMPLAEISSPFEGDHWWYPRNTFWSLTTDFAGETRTLGGAGFPGARNFFREPALETARRPTERTALFNGRDLDGFYTWLVDSRYRDPRRVFTVKDGELRISGDGLGYLATRQVYRDYRLVAEFRWGRENRGSRVGKARDSGIFLHAVGPDGNSDDGDGAFQSAVECQVMEGCVGDLMLIRGRYADGGRVPLRLRSTVAAKRDRDGWPTFSPAGEAGELTIWGRLNWRDKDPDWEDRFGFRGRRDVESPAGEWTRVEATCSGEAIEIRVNGELVNRAHDIFPRQGRILLQCEGSEVVFRKLELEPLRGADG